jgi:acyl-CoA synthetase (AMP-forming)/AMP-acid ligase II
VPPPADPARIAFVQYSSGSTAAPRGFAISHGALAANQAMMQAAIGHDPGWVSVSWLPPHHDMGLVGGILQPLSDGIPAVLLPTLRVIQKPVRWLRAISRWRGTVSTGPTFTSLPPCENPVASRWRVAPRRSSSDHATPLPHSGCAWVTRASTRNVAASGLRQPTAALSVGEGCTTTPWGFMLPGIRTC